MTSTVAIRALGLTKRFGDLVAVAGVDLEAHEGMCLGLLGPNGAGKTTTIEMLEGLVTPDAGEATILGMNWASDAAAIRQKIGVQLQETVLQDKLTVFECLRLFRSFYDEGRELDEVLTLIGLTEKATARVVTLSGGQRQRLALGCALVNDPAVLFLDEPTTGLDPQARRRVWEVVEEFKGRGGCVLLTTHYMDEAERLADQLAIMDQGQLIVEGTPSQIIGRLGAESIIEFRAEETAELPDLEAIPGVTSVRRAHGVVVLQVRETQPVLHALLSLLAASGVGVEDLRTHRPTLEDVFVHLTGKQLRDA